MNKIEQKLKDLPEKPGVYIMRDDAGQILYIGKARSLKNRVRQYFGSPKNKTTKVLIMVSKIDDFDYIITRNEIEALVLENNLIKEHKPPYNILLKDDKAYPFIKINLKEDFPRIEVVRKLKKDGAKYFGPYMQGITSKDILELINSAFSLRSCKLNMNRIPSNHRPCLNYHIGRCHAPCAGHISSEEYHDTLSEVVKFLNGNDKEIAGILKGKMAKASEEMDFELAIYYRERLKVLDKLVRKQVTALPGDLNMDIFAVASNGANTVVAVLVVRGGKLLGGDKRTVNDASLSESIALGNFIMSYYSDVVPVTEIVTAVKLEDEEILSEYLSGIACAKVNIITPIQGVRRQLADMAETNAQDYLDKCVNADERKYNKTLGSVNRLKQLLSLNKTPLRMECFDISHIGGTDKVASMSVFTNGEPDRKMYRKFKIKWVEGNNDFACMYEVLCRRLNELKNSKDTSFSRKPDLIVIDGGLGQLEYASRAMRESGIEDIEMISLAEREEEIYRQGSNLPVVLSKSDNALNLLQRLRDEAHRFAVTFHRQLRQKRQTESVLMKIDGVGKARVNALFQHFKTIDRIKSASVDELCAVKGISASAAANIVKYFNSEVGEGDNNEI